MHARAYGLVLALLLLPCPNAHRVNRDLATDLLVPRAGTRPRSAAPTFRALAPGLRWRRRWRIAPPMMQQDEAISNPGGMDPADAGKGVLEKAGDLFRATLLIYAFGLGSLFSNQLEHFVVSDNIKEAIVQKTMNLDSDIVPETLNAELAVFPQTDFKSNEVALKSIQGLDQLKNLDDIQGLSLPNAFARQEQFDALFRDYRANQPSVTFSDNLAVKLFNAIVWQFLWLVLVTTTYSVQGIVDAGIYFVDDVLPTLLLALESILDGKSEEAVNPPDLGPALRNIMPFIQSEASAWGNYWSWSVESPESPWLNDALKTFQEVQNQPERLAADSKALLEDLKKVATDVDPETQVEALKGKIANLPNFLADQVNAVVQQAKDFAQEPTAGAQSVQAGFMKAVNEGKGAIASATSSFPGLPEGLLDAPKNVVNKASGAIQDGMDGAMAGFQGAMDAVP